MVFYSISLAFGPIAMITSIGMILPSDYIGTGLGMYKASNNSKYQTFIVMQSFSISHDSRDIILIPVVGTSILDIIIGVVQDNTAGQAYTGMIL